MNPAVAHKGKGERQEKSAPVMFIPFTHAAHEHTEAISDDSLLIAANVTARGPFDVPSYGYIRNIYLLVTTSGGVDGTAAAHEDAPFNVLQNVAIEDVNGTPIVGPYNGDELFYVNKYGGYQFYSDPEQMPFYSANALTFAFALRIPVEINPRTGLGCLSNMNSSATYKLRYSLNQGVGATGIVTALGTGTLPTVRVRAYLEAWSLPPEKSRDGFPIADEPPMLGTTQYWSKKIVNISAGQQTVALNRVGNQIRTLVAIFRNATPVRNDSNYPDPLTLAWDARTVFVEPLNLRKSYMAERYRYARVAKDTGVLVYDFSHDGKAHVGGEDDGHLWLRTVQASRLEFTGSFGVAGTLVILTNDVAPVATVGRFSEVSASGGIPGAGAGFNG